MPTMASTVGLYASSAILAFAHRSAWVPSSSANIPTRSFNFRAAQGALRGARPLRSSPCSGFLPDRGSVPCGHRGMASSRATDPVPLIPTTPVGKRGGFSKLANSAASLQIVWFLTQHCLSAFTTSQRSSYVVAFCNATRHCSALYHQRLLVLRLCQAWSVVTASPKRRSCSQDKLLN